MPRSLHSPTTRSSALLFFLLISIIWTACDDSISPRIYAPELTLPPQMGAVANEEFSMIIEVIDPQDLDLDVTIGGNPEWLEFIPEERLLLGVPMVQDTGSYNISITADNGTRRITRGFTLTVFAAREAYREYKMRTWLPQAAGSTTPNLRGVSVAVIDSDGNLHTAFTGEMGTSQSSILLDENSMFRIASVTKPMTTALVLKLVDDGVIGLDDILLNHYPTNLPNAGSMTLRQMLSHTAGVFDHLNSNAFWGHPTFTPTKVWSVDELVQFAVQNGPRFFPGNGYGYSNTAFCVLGALVETVTERDLAEAYEQMLFEPMGLDRIVYDDFSTSSRTIPGLALNHRTYEYHLSAAGASGAMVASPAAVASFGRQFYGGRYLSDWLTNALNDNIGARHGGQNYGLGTRIWNISGIPHHGHTGSLMNYRGILMYIPGMDITIAAHTHDLHDNWFNLVDEIFMYVVENFDPTGDAPIARMKETSQERIEQYRILD
jgi:CubicO group peptidase (beta-lactamase class C family)